MEEFVQVKELASIALVWNPFLGANVKVNPFLGANSSFYLLFFFLLSFFNTFLNSSGFLLL